MTSAQRRASTATTAATRTRLVDATAQILRRRGPQAATSRAIADTANENLGAITYYFGSKGRLVAHALAANARSLIEPVVRGLTRDDVDPVSKLLAAAGMLSTILNENRDELPAYLHALAATQTDAQVQDEIRQLHRGLVAVLADDMHEQKRRGLLPEWVDPSAMAQLIVALVNGVAIAVATDPDESDPAAIAGHFAHLLLAARDH
jgi:AcrR family transcriptional regulator